MVVWHDMRPFDVDVCVNGRLKGWLAGISSVFRWRDSRPAACPINPEKSLDNLDEEALFVEMKSIYQKRLGWLIGN